MLSGGGSRESVPSSGILKLMTAAAISFLPALTPVRSSVGLFTSHDESAFELASVESRSTSMSLLALAKTAESRMKSERKNLLSKIREIRDSFGEPVDTVALIREIRDES
jgi:hypothetical protein